MGFRKLFVILALMNSLYGACTLGAQSTNGFGTLASPCEITTAAQLQAINTNATTLGYYYKLMNNIDLTGVSWVNIGTASGDGFRFDGNFDGDNYTISNLTSFTYTTANKGLFGTIEGANSSTHAIVKNLKLDGFNVTNNTATQGVAGSLAGYAKYATISNIQVTNTTVERTATDSSWVGGLIGQVEYSTISDVNVATTVTGGQNVGGLVGRAYQVTVTNSISSGSVTATSTNAGGLIGNTLSSSVVRYCSSSCTVTGIGSGGIGGLIGYAQDTSQIDQSYASGSVEITDNNGPVGGLVGMIQCGTVYGVKVTDCYATGAVSTTGTNAAGYPGLGGLVGYSYQGYMYKCYSTGAVDKTGTYGGAIASVTSSFANNVFYDIQTALANDSTGSASITGVTSKTTAELKTLTTFSSYDIAGADGNYPKLTFGGTTKWTMADYILTYNGNGNTGGTPPSQQGKQNGADITITSSTGTLTKTGYAINRWDTVANGSGTPYAAGDNFTTNADTTLYAQWAVAYLITFNGNGNTGGTAPSNQYKFNGTNLTLASNSGSLVKTGYTYSGWNTASNGGGTDYAEGATYSTEAATTLYAKWTINSYTVTFKDYDGTTLSSPSVNYGSDATPPADPTRTGYTFTGWDTGYTNITANATVTAQYSINSYTVTFSVDGGSAVGDQTINHGSTATTPTAPTKTGYTFGGWYSDAGLTSSFDFATAITGAITLYAKWTINSYTVTFKDYDGSTLSTPSVDYGANATAPANPTRSGYTFTGWDTGYTNISANTTVTAQYSINSYTVTFKDYDGTTLSTPSVNYGANATTPANPTRSGYTFIGWDTGYTNISANTTVTAQYSLNSYTVTFDVNGGSVVANQTINHSSTATTPTAPTKTGYTFGGWYSDAGLTSSYNFATTITGAITLYAKWTATSSLITGYTSSGTTHTVALSSGNVTLDLQDNSTLTYTDVITDIISTLDKSSENSYVKSITTKVKTNGSLWNQLIFRKSASTSETTEYTSTLESEISNSTLTRSSNGTISLAVPLTSAKEAHITSSDTGVITAYTNDANDTATKNAQLISNTKGTSGKVDSNSTITMTTTNFNLQDDGYVKSTGPWQGSIIQKADSNNTVSSTYTMTYSDNATQKSVSLGIASDLEGVSEVSDINDLIDTEDVLLAQQSKAVSGIICVIKVRTSGKVKTYFLNQSTNATQETSVIDYPFISTDYQSVEISVDNDTASGKLKFDIKAPLVDSIEF